MSLQPLFPRDAEPAASPLPPEEPRLLTRLYKGGSADVPEQHHLHSVERFLKGSSEGIDGEGIDGEGIDGEETDAPRGSQKNRIALAITRLRRAQTHDERKRSRQAGAGRRWLLFVAALLAFTGVLAVGSGLWLRHALHTALPQIDGTLSLSGLHEKVEVTRDAQGVPSITAASLDDLLFAQGFVTAQDRLWQMDALRRNAAGELAEVLGSGLVEHDRRQRYLRVGAAAERAVSALAPDQLAQLQAYARGVNAAITQAADHLPIEFHLLHYRPAPWTPRDSLLVSLSMAQDLGTSFPQKLNREALAAHLPPQLTAQLYPVGSWRDRPPTQPPVDLISPHDVPEIPLDETQSGFASLTPPAHAEPRDLLRIAQAFQPCAECRAGSNNWAVASARSGSDAPMLANDMHLALSAPDIWYEAGLHLGVTPGASATLDATGFTLPGVPFIIVGRNAHVAWGFTNLGGDVQELRVEHLRGSGEGTEYERTDGSWAPADHHAELIRVRGGRDETVDVLTTTAPLGTGRIETPIVSPLYPSERRALSLAWTVYDPGVLTAPFLAANEAADGASLVAALAGFGAPSLNLVWADSAGHIGYHALGRIPVRGPAVHHPRVIEPLIVPDAVPAEDQHDETVPDEGKPSQGNPSRGNPSKGSPTQGSHHQPGPQAQVDSLARQASILRTSGGRMFSASLPGVMARYAPTSFFPARRRRPAVSHRLPARNAAAARNDSRVFRGRQSPPPVLVATSPRVAEPVLTPAPAALDYTIGSPLSPVPVSALDPSQQWSGYIPFSDLPAAQNPINGVLATANSRVSSDDYPYALTLDWVDPYRTERIYKLLEGRRKLTPADMLAVQNDVHSELDLLVAQRVAYALDHASGSALGRNKPRLQQAADLLRGWKGDVHANEAAPAIVAALRADLLPTLIAAQIAKHDGLSPGASEAVGLASLYSWMGSGTATELLLQHTPLEWLPPGFANWNDFLAALTLRALDRAQAPRDLASWSYGSVHTLVIQHPVLGGHAALRLLLGETASSGRYAADGDGSTIKAISRQHGPSERFVADLAANGDTLGNLTTGQSGNPASPWFMDQFLPWLHGSSFSLPLHPEDRRHAVMLLPAGTP